MVKPEREIRKGFGRYGPGVTLAHNHLGGMEYTLHVSRNYSDDTLRSEGEPYMAELYVNLDTVDSLGGVTRVNMTLDFEQAVALADTIKENLASTLELLGVKSE